MISVERKNAGIEQFTKLSTMVMGYAEGLEGNGESLTITTLEVSKTLRNMVELAAPNASWFGQSKE